MTKYIVKDKLRAVEFELWNSIIEHTAQEAPIIIINDLQIAHEHIKAAITILTEDE
tara:strand:- start:5570 stop:5737 length:168 start_codon:yes stop_codon:yes gene_type:complete